LRAWLGEKKIIEYLFGENYSFELIKRSKPILRFLAVKDDVTVEHLDLIWNASIVSNFCLKV
jgi:hypothetical protein